MRRPPTAAVALAALALAPAPATAARAVAPPALQDLGGGNAQGIDPPSLATSPRGDLAVAWRGASRAYVAVRRPGRARLGPPMPLADGLADPHVGVLRDGTVLVAGLLTDGSSRPTAAAPDAPTCCTIAVVQRLAPRARRLSAPHPVSVPGEAVGPFGLGFAAGGPTAALLAGQGAAAVAPSGGVFRPPVALPGVTGAADAAVLDAHGRGALLWVEGPSHQQVVRGAPVAGGRLAAPRTVLATPDSRSDFAFSTLAADTDDHGRLTVLTGDSGGGGTPGTMRVAEGPGSGPLRPGPPLATSAGIGTFVTDPALDVSPSGAALAAWRQGATGGRNTTELTLRVRPRGAFAPIGSIAADRPPRVAWLGDAGGVLVTGGAAGTSLRTVAANGRLGAPRRLTPTPLYAVAAHADGARRVVVAYGTRAGLTVRSVRP